MNFGIISNHILFQSHKKNSLYSQVFLRFYLVKHIKPDSLLEIPPLGVHYQEQWNQEDSDFFSEESKLSKRDSRDDFDHINLEFYFLF